MEHRCPYCLPETITGPYDVEHVIPAKLGGNITVPAHRRCNGAAARHVDNPLLRDREVEMLRALSGARNTRTGRLTGGQFAADLRDDSRVLVRTSPAGVDLRQVKPSALIRTVEDEFEFTIPTGDDVDERTEQVLATVREQHPGRTVELIGQEVRRSDIEISYQWKLDRRVLPRFGAKVALAMLAQTMPREWRGSDAELFLMLLYMTGQAYGADEGIRATPKRLAPGNVVRDLSYPWEHTIIVQPGDEGVSVTVVLFGELEYTLGVATETQPVGPRVWVSDYRESRPVTFSSFQEYSLAMVERFDLFGNLADLRPDRPVAQLLTSPELTRLPGSSIDELTRADPR